MYLTVYIYIYKVYGNGDRHNVYGMEINIKFNIYIYEYLTVINITSSYVLCCMLCAFDKGMDIK